MCLGDMAHGLEPTHAIFQGPLSVDLQWQEFDTPESYENYPDPSITVGATMRGVRFQTSDYTTSDDIEPGVVSTPYGFDDSPDAEIISAGENTKGPRSVAMGRHGNFFHWGWAASPKDLTDVGRRTLVNAIAYIRQFDGQAPLVRASSRSRDWATLYGAWAGSMTTDYESSKKTYAEMNERRRAAIAKKERGEKLSASEERASTMRELEIEPFDKWVMGRLRRMHPPELVDRIGRDGAAYEAHYRDHLEYLTYDQTARHYVVDEDCQSLGVSNRDPATLAKCAALLADPDRRDRALAVLHRYTDQEFTSRSEWEAWLERVADRLFFSDVGGYRFYVMPSSSDPLAALMAETLEPTVVDNRVALKATLADGGDGTAVLAVRMVIDDGWHTYAWAPPSSPYPVNELSAKLPAGASWVGDWVEPPTDAGAEGTLVYHGDIVFTRKVKLPAGVDSLDVTVHFQACNDTHCLPPSTRRLTAR